ncbi:hypothetical protein EG329_010962 [Mollisiaceae sp. DMI_Dod_QoI]|nr:hypothetical protein EG329_010962 [Helotiales sp. DMI_Dod_QoI]
MTPSAKSVEERDSTDTSDSQSTAIDSETPNTIEEPRSDSVSGEAEPDSPVKKDELSAAHRLPEVSTMNHQLSQEQRPHYILPLLDPLEEQLKISKEELENKELELRQAKSDIETLRQRLTSIIEDLRGEVQQLQENYFESEKELAEVTSILDSLRIEHQQLTTEKAEPKAPVTQLIAGSDFIRNNSSCQNENEQQNTKPEAAQHLPGEGREEIEELQASIESLQNAVNQAQEEKASMTDTLQGVSGMIQGVLNLPRRELMMSPLQGVLSMMQGILSIDSQQVAAGPSNKRRRVEE